MFRRCFLFLCGVLLIAGCTTMDTIGPITHRKFDKSFELFQINWVGTFGGSKTDIYIRRSEKDGYLQICGFYIKSDGMEEDLTAEWLKYAKITIDGGEIVSTKFLLPQERLLNADSACVKTTTKYQASLAAGKISLSGRNVRLSY